MAIPSQLVAVVTVFTISVVEPHCCTQDLRIRHLGRREEVVNVGETTVATKESAQKTL